MRQLALAMQNQSKDSFPSDTKKNPKDCMAITLRSGREFGNKKIDERGRLRKKNKYQKKKKSSWAVQKRLTRAERKRCSKNN